MRQFLLIFLLCCSFVPPAAAQIFYDKVIQVTGVALTPDSLIGIPDVTVTVKNQNKGTYSGPFGVFSLVCFKGDTLNFSALGFRSKDVVVPANAPGDHMTMVQLMTQDTFFLNETIIHYLPSKERFNYVFQHLQIDDDKYEIARRNTSLAAIRLLSMTTGFNGREAQSYVQRDMAYRAAYSGQQTPQNIFNPLKWAEFIDAWKRGDFRKKKPQPSSSY